MPTIVFGKDTGISREVLQNYFERESIDSRVFFWPLSALPMFETVPGNYNSNDIPKRAINLPSFHDITDIELNKITTVLDKVIKDYA